MAQCAPRQLGLCVCWAGMSPRRAFVCAVGLGCARHPHRSGSLQSYPSCGAGQCSCVQNLLPCWAVNALQARQSSCCPPHRVLHSRGLVGSIPPGGWQLPPQLEVLSLYSNRDLSGAVGDLVLPDTLQTLDM